MLPTKDSKSLYVKEDGYTIRFEYTREFVIVHLMDIVKFTKDVFRRMQNQLYEWSDFLRAMGHKYLWAGVESNNTKMKRLLGGLNFKYQGQAEGFSVYKYEV